MEQITEEKSKQPAQEQAQQAAEPKKKRRALNKVEQAFLEAVCKRIDEPVINARLCYLFEWYTRKAQHNKRWYNCTRFITYLIPCLITLISVYAASMEGSSKWAIAVTATLSAILVGIHHVIDHFRFYENWVRYRGTAEKLKTEAELFLNRCSPYNKGVKDSKLRFAAKIERIAKAELDNWENLVEESHKPFRDENHAALQTGGHPAEANQTTLSAQETPVLPCVLLAEAEQTEPEEEDYTDPDNEPEPEDEPEPEPPETPTQP